MTEEIAATPGWVDERLDEIFRNLPQTSAEITFSEGYPSMPPTPGNTALLATLLAGRGLAS